MAKFYKQLQDLVPGTEPTIMGGMSPAPTPSSGILLCLPPPRPPS